MAVSGAVFVLVALALGAGWLVSHSSRTRTYTYAGPVKQVSLQLGSGDATIVGSPSSTVEVRRTDDYAFGRHAQRAAHFRERSPGRVLRVPPHPRRLVLGLL